MIDKQMGMRSLRGLWVGDCIGNSCQLYNIHDVLKALKGRNQDVVACLHSQFKFSDDTEEGIVLYNHIVSQNNFNPAEPIDLDKLAMEFATRYMEKDPDGETYGYGLMTRKVLRDIYEGVPWAEANKTFRKQEGTSSHVDNLITSILDKKSWKETAKIVQDTITKEVAESKNPERVGSCGNGAVMRVAPLGALLKNYTSYEVARAASLSALPTHDHPEAIAGAMAIAELAWKIANGEKNPDVLWQHVLSTSPQSDVYKGLMKATALNFDTPLGAAIAILGNGSHVTCQDTVPICCWLTIRAFAKGQTYEELLTDVAAIGGDVDTTGAIVGGMYGIIADPPAEWVGLCCDMEEVVE